MSAALHLKPNGKPLPPRRQQVYDFCKAATDAGKPWPSMGEIADHMGFRNDNSAKDVLNKLVWYDRVLTRIQVASGKFEYGFVEGAT